MQQNQHLRAGPADRIFTAYSEDALLEKVAQTLHTLNRKFARDRWWWLRQEDFPRRLTRQDIKSRLIGTHTFAFERAPGLSCVVRVCWRPPLPPKVRPLRSLLVEFRQTPHCTEEEFLLALQEPTPARSRALNTPLKKVMLRIRLASAASRRRNPSQKAVRKADLWRFNPSRLSPLEEVIQRSRRKGDEQLARRLQAWLDGLPPEIRARRMNRERPWTRTVWIHPEKQGWEDILFRLQLILLQEGMIAATSKDVITEEAVRYLMRKRAVVQAASEEGSVRDIACFVFEGLQRHFTEPEDWRALPLYIRQLVRANKALYAAVGETPMDEAKEEKDSEVYPDGGESLFVEALPEQAKLKRGRLERRAKRDESDSLSIATAVATLREEGNGLSVDSLYDWIHKGKVKTSGRRGQWKLDVAGLEQARQLDSARTQRRAVRLHLIRNGRTPAAAKKFIQRRLKAGKSMEEIVGQLKDRVASTPPAGAPKGCPDQGLGRTFSRAHGRPGRVLIEARLPVHQSSGSRSVPRP